MFTIINKQDSKIDSVTKYILSDFQFGKNEVSVIRKSTKDIIVLPSQTNCVMGCSFCHLTGTTRPAKNLTSSWFVDVVRFVIGTERLGSKTILISFMGAGEPLLNIGYILSGITTIHSQIENVRFAICSVIPSQASIERLIEWKLEHSDISLKLHLSVHGIENRDKIVKSVVDIREAIEYVKEYSEKTNSPIEYHYTLVNGVNDGMDLKSFRWLVLPMTNATIKFLTLSENGNCLETVVTKEDLMILFDGMNIEFYDPPGRDVGSSCGMFDKSIYME